MAHMQWYEDCVRPYQVHVEVFADDNDFRYYKVLYADSRFIVWILPQQYYKPYGAPCRQLMQQISADKDTTT